MTDIEPVDISRVAVDSAIEMLEAFVSAHPETTWRNKGEMDVAAMMSAQANEIARQREVIETWADIDRKAAAQIDGLKKALAELLEASEMSDRDMERHEYETVLEDAQRRARNILQSERKR